MPDMPDPTPLAVTASAFDAITVPTTKILAIGRFTDKGTPQAVASIRPTEVRATIRSYLAGKIDQLYFQTESRGVVFVMNVNTREEASAILEDLPLGVAGMMVFELIPIGPLKPLAVLLAAPPV
jgi:hypothetical protein